MASITLFNDFANIVAQAEGPLLPPEDHQQTYYRIGAAVKASMALIKDDINLNYEKMGIFGVSLGGILSSFAMATQPDLSAGYFIVAGGDIPDILTHSAQEEVSAIREKRMAEQGFTTLTQYEAFLRSHILYDPLDMGSTMNPETLGMIIATVDYNVPTDNQMALHEAFGEPQAIYYDQGHVDTVIASLFWGWRRNQIADFFIERFSVDNPRYSDFEWANPFLNKALY